MNLTKSNVVLAVLAVGLAVPTFLQLQKDRATFVDVARVPLLFDGRYQKFTLRPSVSDSVGKPGGHGPAQRGQRTPRAGAPQSPIGTERRAASSTLKQKGVDDDGHEWLS